MGRRRLCHEKESKIADESFFPVCGWYRKMAVLAAALP
jgi:hypothetical protein